MDAAALAEHFLSQPAYRHVGIHEGGAGQGFPQPADAGPLIPWWRQYPEARRRALTTGMPLQATRPLYQQIHRRQVADHHIHVAVQTLLEDLGGDQHLTPARLRFRVLAKR